MTTKDGSPLKRTLGLGVLVLYGLGIVVGAGIYVSIGAVIAAAGSATPWSFALAGALAALTGLSYAELAARYPEAAGAPAFVKEAFGSDLLSRLTGATVALVVVVSAASIARGCAAYLQVYLDAPAAPVAFGVALLALLIACLGVRESVGVAAVMTVVEIGGLLLVVAAGWTSAEGAADRLPGLVPHGADWGGVFAGAFLAFFAFIGFENLVNMAEEAREPERTLPRAILLSLGLSTLLYVAVALTAALVASQEELAGSATPLLTLAQGAAWFPGGAFTLVAIVAVANGVLIELVMLGRLIYGMARRGWLPAGLAAVTSGLGVPLAATLTGGAIVLVLTAALPFGSLVALSSSLSLLVFAAVNAALWRLHHVAPRRSGFRAPGFAPPLATVASLALAAGASLA